MNGDFFSLLMQSNIQARPGIQLTVFWGRGVLCVQKWEVFLSHKLTLRSSLVYENPQTFEYFLDLEILFVRIKV